MESEVLVMEVHRVRLGRRKDVAVLMVSDGSQKLPVPVSMSLLPSGASKGRRLSPQEQLVVVEGIGQLSKEMSQQELNELLDGETNKPTSDNWYAYHF